MALAKASTSAMMMSSIHAHTFRGSMMKQSVATLTSFVGRIDGLRWQTELVHQRPQLARRQSAAEHAHSLQ